MSPVSIGVIGVGGFGQHHPRVISELPDFHLEGVYDLDSKRAFEVADRNGTKAFPALEALLEAVEAVCVIVPTSLHAEIAVRALNAGKHVFVEKPIAADLHSADAIIEAADAAGCRLAVGQIERFNPAFAAATRDFSGLRLMRAERLGVWIGTNIDVDVVIDLMIHDIDLLVALDPSEVTDIRATGITVLAGKADIANARIELESGAVAILDASRISRTRYRTVRLYSADSYLSIDLLNRTAFSTSRYAEEGRSGIVTTEITVPDHEPLKEELKAFQHLIEGKPSRIASGIQARKSLKLALAVSAAVKKTK